MFDKELMNNISRKDFAQLKEEDVKFITTPGRMGDVDGITFIIFKNGKYIIIGNEKDRCGLPPTRR